MISSSGTRVTSVPAQRSVVRLPARPVARRLREFLASAGWWVFSVGLVVALWEVAASQNLINTVILPPPHMFISEIQHQAQFLLPQVGVRRIGGNFVALTAIVASLRRVLAGLALAFVAALLTGSLAFYLKVFHKLTFPMLTLLAPIAPVAWIPFALVAFGIGDGAAIFVVFVGIFFTLELATVQSMYNVEQLYINTARVLGANRHQVLRYVIFPAILPNLFVIMRLNLFGAWMGVLAAEMVGVNTGLGTIVLVGRQMMNMNLTFLGMALIGLMGYLLDTGFALVQRRVLWWRSAAHL
jgi:ABC-type nitrate/sulfonate/bicarbonate transport system permease component